MPKLTKRLIEYAEIRESEYFIWDDDIPGFGLRVLPSKRKSYIVQYRAGRRSRRMSLGLTVSKLKAAKASEPFIQEVRDIAARHPGHPRLHTDIRTFIELTFACAAEALDHFSEFKRERGLLDFTDQEACARSAVPT